LDPRSFHAFKYRGDFLLFDLSTGATCRLNEFTFDAINVLAEHDWPEAVQQLNTRFPDLQVQQLRDCIAELQGLGFFRQTKPLRPRQDKQLNVLWRHHPRSIQMFVAQTCNLACKYCYAENQGSNAVGQLMSWDVAEATINHLVQASGSRRDLTITFFGGEPLMNVDLIVRTVNYCKEVSKSTGKRFAFTISTNGTLLTEDVRAFLNSHGFTMLVSLDGYADMHNAQRPFRDGSPSYQKVLENATAMLATFREQGQTWRIKARANLTSQYHDMKRTTKAIEDLGFTTVGLAAIRTCCGSTAGSSDSGLNAKDFEELDLAYESTIDDVLAAMEAGRELSPYARRWIGKAFQHVVKRVTTLGLICGVGRNTNAVDCRGSIYPCHRYVGMEAYRLGDVWSGLDREKTMAYYSRCNETAITNCQGCWLRFICAGACPWERSHPTDGVLTPTEPECGWRHRAAERGIWLYHEVRERFPEYLRQRGSKPGEKAAFDFDD
jgi:uncharacterized protein